MSTSSSRASLTLALAAAFAAACGPERVPAAADAILVRDDAGHELRLDDAARRVVSLIPARTDAILALGAGDRLIARTRWDTAAALAQLPSIDNALTPSVEWLVAQRPDLVIAWPDGQARSIVARLRELGIPVYASGVETLADLERAIAHLGTLLGLSAEADALLRAMRATIDSTRLAVASAPAVDVAYVLGLDPPTVAGPGTYIDEVMRIAGGRNVFADAPAKWPQVSLEELVGREPHVLIVGGGGSAEALRRQLRARPGWRDLAAVREGRVYTVDADAVNRPGPSVVETVRLFARLLHAPGRKP